MGHISCIAQRTLKFDFLVRLLPGSGCRGASEPSTQGKDSIRYLQEHEVLPQVYEAIRSFSKGAGAGKGALRLRSRAGKAAEDNLFDKITPEKVNKHLQTLLPGLTIKVFRTYNASFTQSRLLKETDTDDTVMGKKKQARRA